MIAAIENLIVTTLHADFEDFPYVEFYSGLEVKLVHARPEQNIYVLQMRAQPGIIGSLHRHEGPVFGFTTRGTWGHEKSKYPYCPNSYVCEPNELHRFHNGPEVSEAYYINTGDHVQYDPEGREEIRRRNAADFLKHYLERCEELKLPRPNVLR